MVLLSIGFTYGKCDIYERLRALSTYFKDKGICIGLVESDSDDMHFIKCVIRDEDSANYSIPEIKKSFNIFAANILYETIVDSFQIDVINKILKDNYYYFKEEEVHEVAERCIDLLNGTGASSSEDYLIYANRKNKTIKKILDYINENTDIIIEGFMTFRLRDFSSDMQDIVDRMVEEYLVEREYNEFVKLLKYFVEIQESRIETVNVVVGTDGRCFMYDGEGNEITEELLRDLTGENFTGELNYDDLLVSSLITASPAYIIIHNQSNAVNKEMIETIKNVFSERVKVCTGCGLCIKENPVHRV